MRTFPTLALVTCAAAALLLSLTHAQDRNPSRATGQARQGGEFDYYTGKSSNGNFQEALNLAIANGFQERSGGGGEEPPIADAMLEWQFYTATGRHGGIAGFNEVNVTIRVAKK